MKQLLLSLLKTGSATEADLYALQRFLLDSPSTLATNAILEFLESGRDASTGLEFAIRPGGSLSSPTLRILLLDTLGRIAKRDGSGPAAQLARATLEKKDSADEWTIALRNLAWQEPQSTVFLAGKMREMLNYLPWRSAPTSGLLEAFDLFVFTKDPTLTADLVALQDDPLPEIRRAADVALDRLAAANPLEIMGYLRDALDLCIDVNGQADGLALVGDEAPDLLPNPPSRVGRKLEASAPVVAVHGLEEADVSLL